MKRYLCILSFLSTLTLFAQDSLFVNWQTADSLFFADSYYLLAQHLKVDATKARALQQKLYPNPVFTADFNLYDWENQRYLHAGKSGQKTMQVEQLVLLGGKRHLQADIASTEVRKAEVELEQVALTLRSELHLNLYKLARSRDMIARFDEQIVLLNNLIENIDEQTRRGNIPANEGLRLKTLLLSIGNKRAEWIGVKNATRQKLAVLLQTDRIVSYAELPDPEQVYLRTFDTEELTRLALTYRQDLRALSIDSVAFAKQLLLEKRTRVPDLNLFVAYDQRGGAFRNQVNGGLSLALPLWDRNQGNILSATYELERKSYERSLVTRQVVTEVWRAHSDYSALVSRYYYSQDLFGGDLNVVYRSMAENFLKRNISILQFVDFFESYVQTNDELLNLKIRLVETAEQLNLAVGNELFNP